MALVAISALPSSAVIASSDILPAVIGGATKRITAGTFRTQLFAFAAADPLNIGALTAVGNSTITGTLSGITSLTIGGALAGVTTLAMAGALSGVTTLAASGTATVAALTVTTAVGKIIPGATSISHRNNADSADNLLISDAGIVTVRAGLVLTAGSFTYGAAVGKLIPGATSWSLRNNADSGDNLIVTDAGLVTIRNDFLITTSGAVQFRMKDGSQGADAKDWTIQNTAGLFRLRAVNDAVSSGANALTVTRSGASPALMALMPDAGTVSVPGGSATVAGFMVTPRVGNPSAPNDGDLWVTTAGAFGARLNGGTKIVQASATGNLIGTQVTGYTNAWTGAAANRATSYDAASITLPQLAARVRALQEDLQLAHSLIAV